MLYVMVVLWLHFLRLSSDASVKHFKFFEKWVSPPLEIDSFWLDALLCFVLLGVVISYFQTNIYINRQYNYLQETEDKFAYLLEWKMISREGSYYLSNYPLFSNLLHIVYVWVFPVSIIISTSYVARLYVNSSKYGLNTATVLFFLLPLVTTALATLTYLISLNFTKDSSKEHYFKVDCTRATKQED